MSKLNRRVLLGLTIIRIIELLEELNKLPKDEKDFRFKLEKELAFQEGKKAILNIGELDESVI